MRELVRQNRKNLEIIKPSPGYDVDILCRGARSRESARRHRRDGGQLRGSRAGSGSHRTQGSSNSKTPRLNDPGFGLRAASYGIPFQAGGRRIPAATWPRTQRLAGLSKDPYTGRESM